MTRAWASHKAGSTSPVATLQTYTRSEVPRGLTRTHGGDGNPEVQHRTPDAYGRPPERVGQLDWPILDFRHEHGMQVEIRDDKANVRKVDVGEGKKRKWRTAGGDNEVG